VGLSAHLRREGSRTLSAKTPSPVQQRREAVAESFLSVKALPRGKTRSTRVTSLSAKGLNPVVKGVTTGGSSDLLPVAREHRLAPLSAPGR
jgi:hypothetical protein